MHTLASALSWSIGMHSWLLWMSTYPTERTSVARPLRGGRSRGDGLFTVQCDFDDTITVDNVGAALLDAYASREWREIEARYEAGHMALEESNRQQFGMLKITKHQIDEYVNGAVEARPGFTEFVAYCRETGVDFVIVSSGLDLYIEAALQKLGLPDVERYSARGEIVESGMVVRYLDPRGVEMEDGFKAAWLEHLRRRGRPVICIGDGRSDIPPALEADYVFARDGLREHLHSRSIPHFSFDTFHDVRYKVEELLLTARERR